MRIQIEKGVPIPKPSHSRTGARYPWSEMEVGDSFFVEANLLPMRSNACQTGNALGRKFIVKQVGSGVRVWRIR